MGEVMTGVDRLDLLTFVGSILDDRVDDGRAIAGDFSDHVVGERSKLLFLRQQLVQRKCVQLHRVVQVRSVDRHVLDEGALGEVSRDELERLLAVVLAHLVGEVAVNLARRRRHDDDEAARALHETFNLLTRVLLSQLLGSVQIFFCFPARIDEEKKKFVLIDTLDSFARHMQARG